MRKRFSKWEWRSTLLRSWRVFILAFRIPLLAFVLLPFVVIAVVCVAAVRLQFPAGLTSLYEPLLAGFGVAAALAGTCFNYSRASTKDPVAVQVGESNGRFLLVAAVLLATGVLAEFARVELLPTNVPGPAWLMRSWEFALGSTLATMVSGATITSSLALARLYWHAIQLYLEFISQD